MKKLLKALAILSSFSVLTRALGFLFRIFLSRLVGAEGLGAYQIAFSVFMVLETFVSSGLPLVVSKMTAGYDAQGDKKSEWKTVGSALMIGVITAVMLLLIVLLFRSVFAGLFTDARCLTVLLILMPSLIFSTVYSVLRGNLWGHKKFFFVSVTEFIEQIARMTFTVLLLGVFHFATQKVFMAGLSYTASCVISATIVAVLYFKMGGKMAFDKKTTKSVLKSSTPITLVRVVSSLLSPIISIILPLQLVASGYTSAQALAVFGVAMGMTFPLLYVPSTLISSLSMTIIPDLSSSVQMQQFDEIKKRIHFSVKFAIFVSFLFIPLYVSLGVPVGEFFYDNAESGIYLIKSAILIFPICLSGISVSCLNALNLEVKSFINYLLGASFLVISIYALTPILGVLSLVVGMVLCLGVASLLNLHRLNKTLHDNFFNFKYLFLCVLSSVPSALISKFLFGLIGGHMPIFFALAICSVAGVIFYGLSAICFGVFDFNMIGLNLKRGKTHKITAKSQE